MASPTIAVRVRPEIYEQIQARAAEEGKTMTVVVQGLLEGAVSVQREVGVVTPVVADKNALEGWQAMAYKAAKAAAKAQFLASMSVSFCSDVTRLMTSQQPPSANEKAAFMAQTDEWAENFALEYLEQE